MLNAATSPNVKRERLRQRLATGNILVLPGAFNPLSAMLIASKGFEGVYLSGAVMAADLGLPDVGLTTLSEVADRTSQIARVTDLPTLVDADTGFGQVMNVARSVQLLEDAGAAGLHIEDQVNPKRCGHLDGKEVVPLEQAVERIRAAVTARRDPNMLIIARTDVRGVADLATTILRAQAYVDAGADVIFPEALLNEREFAAVRAAIEVPILANATEFGQGEPLSVSAMSDVGVNVVIFPVSLLRLAMGAAEKGLDALVVDGAMTSMLDQMQTRSELYKLLDYQSYSLFDEAVFNFTTPGDVAR